MFIAPSIKIETMVRFQQKSNGNVIESMLWIDVALKLILHLHLILKQWSDFNFILFF